MLADALGSITTEKPTVSYTAEGDVRLQYATAPSVAEKANLDEYLSNRRLVQITKPVLYWANSKIVDLDKVLSIPVPPATWEILGGVVSNPSFFVLEVARILGRVVFAAKTVGANAEMRLVEDDGLGVEVVLASFALPDTTGLWKPQKFSTTVAPRAGDMMYRLEGRLGAATSASIRFASVTLLELL